MEREGHPSSYRDTQSIWSYGDRTWSQLLMWNMASSVDLQKLHRYFQNAKGMTAQKADCSMSCSRALYWGGEGEWIWTRSAILSWKFNIWLPAWGCMALGIFQKRREWCYSSCPDFQGSGNHCELAVIMNPGILPWSWNYQEDLRMPKKKTLTGPSISSPATLNAVSELWFLEDTKQEKWSKLERMFHKQGRALREVTQQATVDVHNGSKIIGCSKSLQHQEQTPSFPPEDHQLSEDRIPGQRASGCKMWLQSGMGWTKAWEKFKSSPEGWGRRVARSSEPSWAMLCVFQASHSYIVRPRLKKIIRKKAGTGEMTQAVKCLLHRHEGLSWFPGPI